MKKIMFLSSLAYLAFLSTSFAMHGVEEDLLTQNSRQLSSTIEDFPCGEAMVCADGDYMPVNQLKQQLPAPAQMSCYGFVPSQSKSYALFPFGPAEEKIEENNQNFLPVELSVSEIEHKGKRKPLQTVTLTPFERYCQTGHWGSDSYRGDHLSDLLNPSNKENRNPNLITRGTTFAINSTSARSAQSRGMTSSSRLRFSQ